MGDSREYRLASRLRRSLKETKARSCRSWVGGLASFFPILEWLPRYKLRSHLHHDLIAGATVGIVNVPQGMAYGLLAGLGPVHGLYTSFFFPLVYAFFGTSRHAAIGTFAVTSIMTNDVVSSFEDQSEPLGPTNMSAWKTFVCGPHVSAGNDSDAVSNLLLEKQSQVAITLCFLIAIINIAFGLLRFGFLTVLMSDQLIQGLTTGAAFHVFSSQVKYIFGVDRALAAYHKTSPDLLPLPRFYVCFFSELVGFKWEPFVVTVVCIVFLLVVKLIVDPRTRPRLHFPIPIELILVILTTVAASYIPFLLHNLSVVGEVAKKFPMPAVPRMDLISGSLVGSALTISIMLYSIEVSIAKLFASKNHYRIDPNQEWIGLGMAHLVGSFFGCIPGGASMSRSMVQGSQGCKSPLVNVVNAVIILAVLLGVADLFHYLPKCTLSAIIVVSLKGLFIQLQTLPSVFQKSKTDFLVWVGTFIVTVLSTVKVGLFCGIGISLAIVIYRLIWAQVDVAVSDSEGVRVIRVRFSADPSFLNVERLRGAILEATEIDPVEMTPKKKKAMNQSLSITELAPSQLSSSNDTLKESSSGDDATRLQIDCSSVTFLDTMAAKFLLQMYIDFTAVGFSVHLLGLTPECVDILRNHEMVGEEEGQIPLLQLHAYGELVISKYMPLASDDTSKT